MASTRQDFVSQHSTAQHMSAACSRSVCMCCTQGNTLGRLLLHGLVGNERESERVRMTSVAAGIDQHISETNDALKVTPEDMTRLFDHSVLPHLGCSVGDSAPTAVGEIRLQLVY